MEIQRHLDHRPPPPPAVGASPATTTSNPSWWESISKARARIHALASILSDPSLTPLADSDRPALSLLSSPRASAALSSALSSPSSGSGNDPLCHWLYDTFLSSDPDLRLVVLSFLPLLSGLYLSRLFHSPSPPSLAGFEVVLLAVYSSEVKHRNGKPLLVSVPDLSQPSLYHTPRSRSPSPSPSSSGGGPSVAVLSEPLEAHVAVKSTKRACIVGVAFECYYKMIAQMPDWSKLDLCEFAAAWAGQACPCRNEFDPVPGNDVIDNVEDGIRDLAIEGCKEMEQGERRVDVAIEVDKEEEPSSGARGSRIPLPWELLQPLLRILGHCLLAPSVGQDVKDAASAAVRSLYARAMHDLVPQSILATRSLIHLDKSTRAATREATAAVAQAASNPSTPSKPKKPEILLVSK